MILQFRDWKFDVDLQRTMIYSAAEAVDHCDCAYCRNFYKAVDAAYPHLRPFLAQFGIDIEAPDELMPITATEVMVFYGVSGKILTFGNTSLVDWKLDIQAEPWEVSMIQTECPKPLFVLSIGPLSLPWVLDEPLEEDEIVSPANQPGFLKKMWDRLLGRSSRNMFSS